MVGGIANVFAHGTGKRLRPPVRSRAGPHGSDRCEVAPRDVCWSRNRGGSDEDRRWLPLRQSALFG